MTEKRIIVAGHSFGAATAIEVGRRNASRRIEAIVGLDTWFFPIDKLMKEKNYEITIPCTLINAETWQEDFSDTLYDHAKALPRF